MKIIRYAAVAAPVGGVLLGALDFVWIKYVPYPFAELGNSMAVWAVAGFLLAFWGRWGWARGIGAAVVLLVVAVPSYYLAAMVIQHDDAATMYNTTALLWMGSAVIAGVVFGGAGVAARRPGRWQAVAPAMPAAVLFAEAGLLAGRIGDPDYGIDPLWSALLDVALGVLLTALIAGPRRWVALLWAVPLALVGWVLLSVARFG
ncbi:DUF6518 family protein [Actinoplanes sp. NPDC049599]|uniref:DUF6518 family protein n=1 Tax=Actinoplanes sp. NPDC049599 TaxID=3363903 RepID=UPI00379AFC4E